ncbi:MAG: hypothetical protein ACLU7M_01250 [Mediterraneibacter gnavus]
MRECFENTVEQPLIDKESIVKRLDAVEELKDQRDLQRKKSGNISHPVYDLERLVRKITYQSANPRDLIAFRKFPCPCCRQIKYIL